MDFPILSSLILLPLLGAIFIFFSKSKSNTHLTIKYLALFASFANFILSLYLWFLFDSSTAEFQFLEEQSWIKGFINYKVGIDGISILFIILTTFITPLCVVSVNGTIKYRLKDFLVAILVMESLMIGVFCSLDLVVFYLFFEGGLIPMFLIIGIWVVKEEFIQLLNFFFTHFLDLFLCLLQLFQYTGLQELQILLIYTI